MHVLVTGGAGFIGAHTVRALLAAGHEVTVVDDLSHGRREAVPEKARFEQLDVRAPELMDFVQSAKADAIVHLAAQMDVRRSVADPLFDGSVNVLGTINALEAAARAGVKRFVFASSGGAVYGEQDTFPAAESHPRRPASPYGVSKLCGEEYLLLYQRMHGLSTLAMRYANVYGPGQDPHGEAGVVAIFLEKMRAQVTPMINGDGLQTRDYVHVSDVARANVAAVESTLTGAVNVGTGRETTVVELATQLARHANFSTPPKHGPAKAGEQRRSVVDPAYALQALGWRPAIDLEEGLRETALSFLKNATA